MIFDSYYLTLFDDSFILVYHQLTKRGLSCKQHVRIANRFTRLNRSISGAGLNARTVNRNLQLKTLLRPLFPPRLPRPPGKTRQCGGNVQSADPFHNFQYPRLCLPCFVSSRFCRLGDPDCSTEFCRRRNTSARGRHLSLKHIAHVRIVAGGPRHFRNGVQYASAPETPA